MAFSASDILLRLLLEDDFSGALDKALAHYEQRIKQASSVKELDAIEREWKEITNAINQAGKAAATEAKLMKAQAADIVSGLEKVKIAQLNAIAGGVQSFSNRALVGGTGLIGGILAEGNRFAKEAEAAEEATNATRAWTAATEELADARKRVDTVLIREALPLLKEVAGLATQASSFVESHPEIVQSALNAGKILIALGAIGTVASKGIKLVADVRYLLTIPAQIKAAQLQDQAAAKQLFAAELRAKEVGLSSSKPAGSGAGLLNTIGLVVAGLTASAAVVALVDQILEKSKFGKAREDAINQARDQGARIYPGILPPAERKLQVELNKAQLEGNTEKIAQLRKEIDNLGNTAEEASQKASLAIMRLAGSENEGAIVSAFTKWKEDDRRLIQEAAENRKKIYLDAEKSIADAARQYSRQTLNINKQYDSARADLIRDFAENSKQSEIDYAQARADIVRDAGEDIRQIEEQHQENIRQMTLEHNQRVEDLTASRDALGLAKEHERFDQERSESERQVNQEIAQRRREVAVRLQELAAEFAIERAQRQAHFEQALAENQARRQEELKEAAVAHAEELRQIREQKAVQLRELQQNLNTERLRRREVFIAEVRDLDQALLGERNLKNQYYDLMLADAERWLADYRAKLSAGTTSGSIPSRDVGGYVGPGVYRVGPVREFVMDPRTTRAAEQVIGGQLNQRSILNAMMGRRGQIVLNDHRRFDSRLSLSDRRTINQDTLQTLESALG